MHQKRVLTSLVLACIAGLGLAVPAWSYEPDTHFQMTYTICRAAGFHKEEAIVIAAADQAMDDAPDCLANSGPGGTIPHVRQEMLFHAFDLDGKMGPGGILARKERMYRAAVDKKSLVLLGVFFHYQQDTWAHRHHYDKVNLTYDHFTTYNTPFGHAKDFHQPDRPPFDPVCALECLEDTLKYAQGYLTEVLHRPLRPFLAGYRPTPGNTQRGWKPNGPYFHQLGMEGASNTPREFMIDLIRTQIAQYGSSPDPRWGLHETANLIADSDLPAMAAKLEWCCSLYHAQLGYTLHIPTIREKEAQGFMHLSVDGLIRMGMPGD